MSVSLSSFEVITGLPEFIAYGIVVLLGGIVGSFLNVVIHRIPLGQSIIFPSSACPNCKSPVKAYDNIPILGWLILRGKCRACKNRISARYPVVELLTAFLFTIVYWQIGLSPFLPVCLLFISAIVILGFIDAEHLILPNLITYPLLVFALAVRITYPLVFDSNYFSDLGYALATYLAGYPAWLVSFFGAVVGAAAGGGSLWVVGEAWKRFRGVEAMGLGDVKMMFGVGAFLGWRLAIFSIFVAAFSGAIIGIVVIARQKEKNFQTQMPFGIFLGLGTVIALLFGEQMIAWYIEKFIL